MSERRRLATALDLEQAAIADIKGPEDAVLAEGEAVAQGRKGLFVELLAPGEVADFDRDVVEHPYLWGLGFQCERWTRPFLFTN